MSRRSFTSLRVRLILLVVLAVLPAFGLILYTGLEQRRVAAAEAQTNALGLARLVTHEQEHKVMAAHQLLATLAQLPAVRDSDPAACNALFADLLKQYAGYTGFAASEPDGDVFCSAIPLSGPVNFADRAWFQRVVQTREFAASDYQIGRITGKAILVFGYPVLDAAGRVQAVVSTGLDLAWLNQLAAEAQLPPGSALTVIDRDGTILIRYPNPEKWVGRSMPEAPLLKTILAQGEGTAEAPGVDGIPRLYAFTPLHVLSEGEGRDAPGDSLYVSVGIPRQVAFAQANRTLARNLAGLGLVAVLAFTVAWVGADLFVLRRVEALLSATQRLAAGDLSARTKLPYGVGELSQLARAFDQMAEALERHEAESRRQVTHQEALTAIIAAAAAAQDLPELLETVLSHILRALGLEIGAIWLPGQHVLRGLPPEFGPAAAQTAQAANLDIPGPIAVEDWRKVPDRGSFAVLRPFVDRFGVRASVTVPILANGRSIGGLSVAAPQSRVWSAEEIGLVEAVGRQLGAAAQRLRLLAQTQQQARQMQQIMDTVPEGVLLMDASRRILLANPAAREHLALLTPAGVGNALTHLDGRPIEELLRPPPEGLWHEVLVDGPPRRAFEVGARPAEQGAEAGGWVLVIRDVTQERAVQQRVQQQERLAAVGQLAAGIAHDFSNILTGMVGFAQLLLTSGDVPEHARADLARIVDQGHRGGRLIHQLLDFSRKSTIERWPLDLGPFLKEAVNFLERIIRENIHIVLEMDPREYLINADSTQLQQVLTNLALNARDAMPNGGELRLRLSRFTLRPGEQAPFPNMGPGEWIALSVSDTGVGIPAEVLPHIFEPFFTTREPGQGTGLGLAQVYGIVKQHEGYIDVESQVGQGTTFFIYLPASAVWEEGPREEAPGEIRRGQGETVLLVEDDRGVLEAGRAMLEHLGYPVLTAADGQQALETHAAHKDEIALVFSDMVMPKMGGLELYQLLRERDPAIRMVVVTGYPLGEEIRDVLAQGIAGWVQKPFMLEQLAQVLHRTLNG